MLPGGARITMTGSTPVEGIPWLDASRGYTMARRQSRAYHVSTPVEGIPWLDASRGHTMARRQSRLVAGLLCIPWADASHCCGSWRACCALKLVLPSPSLREAGHALGLAGCLLPHAACEVSGQASTTVASRLSAPGCLLPQPVSLLASFYLAGRRRLFARTFRYTAQPSLTCGVLGL